MLSRVTIPVFVPVADNRPIFPLHSYFSVWKFIEDDFFLFSRFQTYRSLFLKIILYPITFKWILGIFFEHDNYI